MKKILVPIDFSKPSEYASKLASTIAKKANSEVHLLHMVELPTGFVDMGSGTNFSIPESMLYIRKVRDRMLDYKKQFFPKTTISNMLSDFKLPLMEFKITLKRMEQILLLWELKVTQI